MIKLRIHECMCRPCSECVRKYVCWCQKHLCNVHTCTHSGHLFSATPTTMNTHTHAHARLCNGAITSLPETVENYLESCASIVQAIATRPPVVSTMSRLTTCSLKKTILIHANSWRGLRCVVAQASSNHPRWCGTHPGSQSLVCIRVWTRSHNKILFLPFFRGHFIVSAILASYTLPMIDSISWMTGGSDHLILHVYHVCVSVHTLRAEKRRKRNTESVACVGTTWPWTQRTRLGFQGPLDLPAAIVVEPFL